VRRFEGKTFWVTGATSGIGLETARRLAKEGAAVVCSGRRKDVLDQVVSELPGDGHVALAFDVALEEEVNAAGNMLKTANRVIHGAVFCAGRHFLRPLQMTQKAHIDDLLSGNLISALLCTKFAAKCASDEGASFVWLSSASALIGNPGEAIYAASKGALIAACRSVAAELATKRIRVNAVAPGVVKTPMSEKWLNQMTSEQKAAIEAKHLLGFGTSQDVAAAIVFLLSEDARWITGTCLTIDGGLTCH
jgi:NAD(P)-dependent dehydrogenase (short-subunit alcohol dehydrogenase family)